MIRFIPFVFTFLISGCGTIISHTEGNNYYDTHDKTLPRVYSGVIWDFRCFHHPHIESSNNLELFCLIDLPISFALDTLILPYTGYKQIVDGSYISRENFEK